MEIGTTRGGRSWLSIHKFEVLLLSIQILLVILLGACTTYGYGTSFHRKTHDEEEEFTAIYNLFQHINIMIFIGFGFLMVFLKAHSWSSIGLNYMAAIFSMQLYILFSGFWKGIFEGTWETIKININLMVNAEFCAAAVLISFGGVLGKVSPFQLLSMAAFESFIYSLNERLVSQKEDVVDIGGSILIHTFGAYFGLMVSWMISPPSTKNHPHNVPNYISNALTFVGTIFLWIYWPSFNGIYTFGNARHRAVLGTMLSLCGSCMSTFIFSRMFKGGLFHMEDILNASLAGGVVIGSTCNIIVDPFAALLLGLIIGLISTWGFEKLSPFLQKKLNLYDTCGIHNLHGMPGVIGGIVSIIVIGTSQDVGEQLIHDPKTQALYQLAGLVTTLAIALVSGFIVGAIIRTEFFEPPKEIFNDKEFWVVESEEHQENEGYRALKIQDP